MARALGIDLGGVRVGVALSDELGMLAHPLETIMTTQLDPLERIHALAMRHAVSHVVVGIARNMDGSHGPAAEKAQAFMEQLRERLECAVVSWDERLSTVEAHRRLREAGRRENSRREVIDQAAAQIILQGWLDAQAIREPRPGDPGGASE